MFMDSRINITLKFAALNICDVLSKSKFPELIDFVNMFDIICLFQTKLDQFDKIHVNNFEILTLSRNRKQGARYGGITILIKSELYKYVDFLEMDSSDAIWFNINKPLVKIDIICEGIHISPKGS